MRANQIATYTWHTESRTHEWDWGPLGKSSFAVPASIVECEYPDRDDAAMVFGFKQTIADAAAKSDATREEKKAAMDARIAVLVNGEWKSSTRGVSVDVLLVLAVCEVHPDKKREDVVEFLSARTKAERDALASGKKYGKIVERLRRERTKSVNVADLEAGIDAIGKVEPQPEPAPAE